MKSSVSDSECGYNRKGISRKEIANGYDKIADKIFMSDKFYQTCIKIAGKIEGNIIDIGCGQGFLLEKILKKFKINLAAGIDISPQLCSIAVNRIPNATILNLDAEDIDTKFNESLFDFVFMTEVLEHLLDPWKVLIKVSKILRPNGKLILTVPNRDWFGYEKYKVSRKVFQPVDDHFYKIGEIKKLLEQSNFQIEKIRGEEILFHSSGVVRKMDKVLLLLFPILNRKMKRLIILARNKKKV